MYISDKIYELNENIKESEDALDSLLIEYRKHFNEKLDILLRDIECVENRYEDILTLRYKTKVFKDIDPEFLIELRYGNHIYDLNERGSRLKFYKENKDLFKVVEERLKEV